MSKYDEGFKLMIVNAYLAGEGGYLSLAKKTNCFVLLSTSRHFINNYLKYLSGFFKESLVIFIYSKSL
jgi:hypothetical protein